MNSSHTTGSSQAGSSQATEVEAKSQTELPPSSCVMLNLSVAAGHPTSWEVRFPDGSTSRDFRSDAAAKMVQRCFYEDGLTPDDKAALALVGTYFWLSPQAVILSDPDNDGYLFEDSGLSFAAPTVEHTEDGFIARYFATETELFSLLWVEATVTPEYVEYSVQRSRFGKYASPDESLNVNREPPPPGTKTEDLLSAPQVIRF